MSADARPNSTRLSVLLPFGIVVLIWGSTWIVIADQIGPGSDGVPPQWSVAYRFMVAGLAMTAVAWWRGDRWPRDARGLVFASVLGLFQFCLNFNFVYQAERFVTSGLVAVVFALMLVPNALLGRVFLGQRLGRQLLLGSAVAVTGIALLFVHEARVDPNGPAQVMLGVGLTLLGVLSASITNVMQGSATARAYPMASMLAAGMLMGAAIDASFAWTVAGPPSWDPRPAYALGVLYLGVFASAVAFTLYFGVIRVIGPAKAAYNSVVVPVIAMLLSTLFEGYRWSALAVMGGLLAGVGLVIALTARRPNR